MKATTFFTLLALVSPLAAQKTTMSSTSDDTTSQAPTPRAEPTAEQVKALMPNQQAFLNLPEEKRKEFVKHLSEAGRLFNQKRIFETLDVLDKAEKVFADSPEILNLRGSCYVEMRNFDKALACYEKAKSYAKANPSLDFNIAEVHFCTKQWQKSLDAFEKIFKDLPKQQVALGRIIEYKMMLCMLKLGMKADAAKLAAKYNEQDDSPFFYFAEASKAYEKKDLTAAEAWLGSARRVFTDAGTLSPWLDTITEYGYMKSLYGDDE
jgi:tetratricopeptide (TPR) repeat protein